MSKSLQSVLMAIGLGKREARLYLIGLRLGSAPASEYAKKTKLNRITAYNYLEDLVQRGIFTVNTKERAKWYAPVDPEVVAVDARKHADAMQRNLSELRALKDTAHRKPTVRFFEGTDGIRKVYEDTLTAGTEILNFANSAVVREYWPEYDEEYVGERVQRKIKLRGIAPNDKEGRRVHGDDKKNLRQIRLVPPRSLDFSNEINIYDSKVAIVSFSGGEVFGVIIESPEVAKAQRQIFEMAWRFAGHS